MTYIDSFTSWAYDQVSAIFSTSESRETEELPEMAIVTASSDLKGQSLETALKTARVVLLLDFHDCDDMHQANARVINAHWKKGDAYLFEGDAKNTANQALGVPTKHINPKIIQAGSSWDIDSSLEGSGLDTSFIRIGANVTKNLFGVLLNTVYDQEEGIYDPLNSEQVEDLWISQNALEKLFKRKVTSKEDFLKQIQGHSFTERLDFIHSLASQHQKIVDTIYTQVDASASEDFDIRTDSMINCINQAIDSKVQRVWVTCGIAHGEHSDPAHAEDIERLYAHLNNKGLSYLTLRTPLDTDALPGELNSKEHMDAINTLEDEIISLYKPTIDSWVEFETKLEKHFLDMEAYHASLGQAYNPPRFPVFTRSFLAAKDELDRKEGEMYLPKDLPKINAFLNRVAYWAKHYRLIKPSAQKVPA